ncbi:hypothetical protein [Gluconobacter cadivus]|uniref:Uncharacterized protein n=1 Tax=Gluconobacter cadivus TaxID=2728101 RepID=A0ABR9YXN4_9PROT|nr:hypothetical protein [Gluconobacter cadivus]MBF0889321.1 hypothetical protein [Gluconobacter cadivus]
MIVQNILDLLEDGLKKSASIIFDFSENPYSEIKPEYLKTVKIAETFKDNINNSIIRLEKNTKEIIGASLFPPRPSGFLACIARNGRVDITISYEDNGWTWPVILIENKIYEKNFLGIDDDVVRCLEFIDTSVRNTQMSIEATCVTFLIKIEKGITQTDHDSLSDAIYQEIIKSAALCKASYSPSIRMQDKKIVLRRGGYKTSDEATFVGGSGESNISENGVDPSIYGCFIVFDIDGRDLFLKKLQ